MTVIDIALRELQRDTSRLVRDVEETGATYRVTVQGRSTAVVLHRQTVPPSGATVGQARASALYEDKPAEVLAAQLAELERSRDEAGWVERP